MLTLMDRAERHDLKSRLFFILFPPKKRGKKKRRIYSKNRDFKSCLSARSKKVNIIYLLNGGTGLSPINYKF